MSKNKLTVAFDLDGVLVDWTRPFWHIAGELVGMNMTGVVPKQYGLQEFPESVASMSRMLFQSEWFMCEAVVPVDGAVDITRLAREHMKPIIVTRRTKRLHDATRTLVRDLFAIDEVRFVDMNQPKWPEYKKHGVDIVVDDCWNDIRDAIDMRLLAFVIRAPWNTGVPVETHNNCTSLLHTFNAIVRGSYGKDEQKQGSEIRA